MNQQLANSHWELPKNKTFPLMMLIDPMNTARAN